MELEFVVSNDTISIDLESPLSTTQNHPIFYILHRLSYLRRAMVTTHRTLIGNPIPEFEPSRQRQKKWPKCP